MLSSFKCWSTGIFFAISKLNNRLIKWTLFEVDCFLYILDKAAIRHVVVLSFALLKATLCDNVSQITLRACLSGRAQSSSFTPSSCLPKKGWYSFFLVQIMFNLYFPKARVHIIKLFNFYIPFICSHCSHLNMVSSRLFLTNSFDKIYH